MVFIKAFGQKNVQFFNYLSLYKKGIMRNNDL